MRRRRSRREVVGSPFCRTADRLAEMVDAIALTGKLQRLHPDRQQDALLRWADLSPMVGEA